MNKAVLALFNNPYINVSDVDLILISSSSSDINLDLANKIKNKLPNALFLKDTILKNEPKNVCVNHNMLREKGYKEKTIVELERMIQKSTVDGVFKIKKVKPFFRKYVINFLKLDNTNRLLLNKLTDGKILIVDDVVTEGTTFKEINRLLENYSPKEVILYSLIG